MPIIGNIKSSKYAPEIRNFTGGTNKLKACISERIFATFEIEIYWYAEPKTFDIFDGGGRIVRKDGGNFNTDGFQIGENFTIQFGFGANGKNNSGSINAISEKGDILFTSLTAPSLNGTYGEDTKCLIAGTSVLDNANYRYGIIENQEPFNTFSKLEGSNQSYYAKDIPLSPAFREGQISGTIKGWLDSANALFITRLDDSNIPIFRDPDFGGVGGVPVLGSVKNYRIEHIFTILPYFTAGRLQDLVSGIAPTFLLGNNSLKYVFECTFKQNFTDENLTKTVRFQNLLGSVGNYGESFNGFTSQYSIESVNYFAPSLLSNPSLLVQGVTQVVCVINSSQGTFTGTESLIIAHSYLPENEDEYTNSSDFFSENFAFEQVKNGVNGDIIYGITKNLLSASQLEVTFLVDVSNVKPTLTAQSNYLLSVIVENPATTQEESDRTILLIDVNNYDLSPDIPGLFEVTAFSNYDHGTDISEIGFSDYKGWIQDGYTVKGMFRLNRTLNAILENFSIKIVAWKNGTNDYFELQSTNFNVSNAVIDVNGNQQIFINETQGFKLDSLDQFNTKTLVTGAFLGMWIDYGFGCGLKINWQDWLKLPNADVVFYDVLEPNQGLNQNASRYSLKENYTLQTIILAQVSQNGISTDYINKSQLIANNFGEIANEDWQMLSIETFDEANNSLNGNIIGGQYVRIKAEFQPNFAISPILEDYYGIIRIDRQLSQGNKEIYEMSSVRSIPQNNLLIPLEGESLLKLSLNGSNIVLECRTNKNQIQNVPYNLSARLGGKGVVILGDFNDDFNNDFFN